MKFTQTADSLKQEIYHSIDAYPHALNQRYRQIKKMLQQADEAVIAEGIINVFEDTSRGKKVYVDQEFAGRLLIDLKPNPMLTLLDILNRTLPNYNASVEELPLYLVEKFGKPALCDTLELLTKQHLEVNILESIRVFKYWLKMK